MRTVDLFPAQEKSEHLVSVQNNQVVTTSLQVAEYFDKRHADVLRQINNLITLNAKLRLGYESVTYEDSNGKKQPMYLMNRDGFTLLAMGFTGKKAMQFKIAYINAFNEMEDILRSGQENRYALSVLKSELAKVNKNLRRAITAGRLKYGNAYGPAGDIPSSFSLYEQDSFIKNVKNIMAHVNNALLTAYFLNTELQKKDKTIQEMEQALKQIRLETAKVLGY